MQERVFRIKVLITTMAVSETTPVLMKGLVEKFRLAPLKEFLSKQNHQAKISSTDEVQVYCL